MRITIRIDDELHSEARRAAREVGRTLSGFIEDSLRQTMARVNAAPHPKVVLKTSAGRLRPGVNLDDSAALLDIMEGRES